MRNGGMMKRIVYGAVLAVAVASPALAQQPRPPALTLEQLQGEAVGLNGQAVAGLQALVQHITARIEADEAEIKKLRDDLTKRPPPIPDAPTK